MSAYKTANIIDRITGDVIPAYVFVAVLSCSGYAYVEAFLSQKQESWISAHVNAFRYFGGVTRIIVPDNLKTGVEKVAWYSPTINKSYHEMAEHYATAIVPARVRRPKDKPKVEGTVGVISTWIIAALRNDKYFSLTDLNEAISQKIEAFNEKPFQKKLGSRYTAYIQEEKEFLLPMPKNQYELALWKKLIPGFNYHISLEKNFYSVPYEYIKHEMDVRITRTVVETFYHNHRICSHPRIYGKPGQYHTIPEHMPEKHKSHTEWNSERFVSWANSIGMYTATVVKAILNSHMKELLKRDDAGIELLAKYKEISPLDVEKVATDLQKGDFSLHLGFLETILCNDKIISGLTDAQVNDFKKEATINQQQKEKYKETFGLTLDTTKKIRTNITKANMLKINYIVYWTNVYTPNGTAVSVFYQTDMTAQEKTSAANWVTTNYPNATILAPATKLYNCHSYAWYWRSSSNSRWMEDPTAYMTDGSSTYIGTGPGIFKSGLRMYWPDLHSGYMTNATSSSYSNITCTSKWGAYPLMSHKANYCPYSGGTICFYNM